MRRTTTTKFFLRILLLIWATVKSPRRLAAGLSTICLWQEKMTFLCRRQMVSRPSARRLGLVGTNLSPSRFLSGTGLSTICLWLEKMAFVCRRQMVSRPSARRLGLAMLFCILGISYAQLQAQMSRTDSLIFRNYQFQIMALNVEDGELLSCAELDSAFTADDARFRVQEITVAPDKSFKIYSLEVEFCTSYCNSYWYSYVHFGSRGKQRGRSVAFAQIQKIYVLGKRRYLVVDRFENWPASVLTVDCHSASMLDFSGDTVAQVPIPYRQQPTFSFCEEAGVRTKDEPYIRYNPDTKILNYAYGNNYYYSQRIDVDTMRQGQMRYVQGQFVLVKETFTVDDRRGMVR